MTTARRSKWLKFIDRWNDLHEKRAKLDYETAKLANEIRSEFPAGASGDLQFRQWCVGNLEIYGGTAAMLLRAVKVFNIFDESDWYDLGGWQSLQFLSTLKAQGRAAAAWQSFGKRAGSVGPSATPPFARCATDVGSNRTTRSVARTDSRWRSR
jgi:hypothetical protein